jgi:Tol biopolymer transport system component
MRILCFFLSIFLVWENVIALEIITHVSVNGDKESGNSHSQAPVISGDGRYLVFHSDATNLVPNDQNNFTDVFIYDRLSQQIERISVSSEGTESNFVSFFPTLSATGRYVVFQSDASNLILEDDNHTTDIFVHDREIGSTQLVSMSSDGKQGNSTSSEAVISANGRYIAFHSYATNLVKNDTNKRIDVFVHDLTTAETTRVSIKSNKTQAKGASFGPTISADGRYVAFSSDAPNLVTNDKNKQNDIFVRDREIAETVRVSINSAGEEGNFDSFDAALSADGRYVAFGSRATNLVSDDTNEVEDIFVHDQQTGETTRISVNSAGQQVEGASFGATLSADGRYIVFNSEADNLVADDENETTDVFIRDRQTGQTQRLSLASDFYPQTSAISYPPTISANGRWIAFESRAWNLVANDFNEVTDIFLYDRAYYASFKVATGQLYIPVINVPNLGLFKAHLSFIPGSEPLQLTVDRVNSFQIPLEGDIPSTYTPETRLLQLPHIEFLNSSFETLLCQVDMVANEQISIVTVTQLECGK